MKVEGTQRQKLRDDTRRNHVCWLPGERERIYPEGDDPYALFGSLLHATHLAVVPNVVTQGLLPKQVSDSSTFNGRDAVWMAGAPDPSARYGSVLFSFPVEMLTAVGVECFWLEIVDYWKDEAASRILVTHNGKPNGCPAARLYDPRMRGGPWWIHDKKNYALKNTLSMDGSTRNHTLEFVFDLAVSIVDARISVIEHYNCKKNKFCSEQSETFHKVFENLIKSFGEQVELWPKSNWKEIFWVLLSKQMEQDALRVLRIMLKNSSVKRVFGVDEEQDALSTQLLPPTDDALVSGLCLASSYNNASRAVFDLLQGNTSLADVQIGNLLDAFGKNTQIQKHEVVRLFFGLLDRLSARQISNLLTNCEKLECIREGVEFFAKE
jgi:hypothetical protein